MKRFASMLQPLTIYKGAIFVNTDSVKQRLIVLTNICSLEAGVREPDDGQSMIRLFCHASDFNIEGLVATSNMTHGHVTRPELIEQCVAAYEQDWSKLKQHRDFPPADVLRRAIADGQQVAGPEVPIWDSIGEGKNTPVSALICNAILRDDERPLWICVWGGTADLAQALWNLLSTHKSDFIEKLRNVRVHAVYDQDSTGAWIKENFPELFYITRHHGIRGGAMSLMGS